MEYQEALLKIGESDIFVYCNPEILEFSKKKSGSVHIFAPTVSLDMPLPVETQKLKETLGLLQYFLGNEAGIFLAWNIKNFLSFVLARTGSEFQLRGRFFDLKILESYAGLDMPCPMDFAEAKQRLSNLAKKTDWPLIHKAYQTVFLPLIKTIPQLETYRMGDRDKRSIVHAYYEIEGQNNGRLKCSNAFGYNPHVLGPDERKQLFLPDFDDYFMSFDFKHMEVSVLQWLSQDNYMQELLHSGRDFYELLWEELTSKNCTVEFRKKCKEIFLPTIFGMSAQGMADRLTWPKEVCQKVIEHLSKKLSKAFGWVINQQNALKDGWGIDHFGRKRRFDEPYKMRNFVIQSPAALICLHKLNALVSELKNAKVCMHIHDGFMLALNPKNAKRVYEQAKQILESEHEFYSGLTLKVTASYGRRLDDLKKYE